MTTTPYIGRTVIARVTSVEVYGVYLDHDNSAIVVLIPDVSYDPVPDLKERYHVGDLVPVRVLSYVEERGLFKGSIRDAQ